jgi:hypothetical protein
VHSQITIDYNTALSIGCDDNTNGNYYVYNLGNSLIDEKHRQQKTLTLYFDENY